MPSFLRLVESQLQLIARVMVILPSSVSRAAWSSDGTAMVSPRCPGWSHAPCGALDDGAHETVNDWQMYSGGALMSVWHAETQRTHSRREEYAARTFMGVLLAHGWLPVPGDSLAVC